MITTRVFRVSRKPRKDALECEGDNGHRDDWVIHPLAPVIYILQQVRPGELGIVNFFRGFGAVSLIIGAKGRQRNSYRSVMRDSNDRSSSASLFAESVRDLRVAPPYAVT